MATSTQKKPAGKGNTQRAKSSASKSTAAQKTGNGKKPATTGKKKRKNSSSVGSAEIFAGVLLSFGLILLALAVLPAAQSSWLYSVKVFYLGLLGLNSYLLPVMFVCAGTGIMLNKRTGGLIGKLFVLFAVLEIVNGFLFVNSFAPAHAGLGYKEMLHEAYSAINGFSVNPIGSGSMSGALLGGAYYCLGQSRAVGNILLVMTVLVGLMVFFRISLKRVVTGLQKPAERVGKVTETAIHSAKENIERRYEVYSIHKAAQRAVQVDPDRVVGDFYGGKGDKSRKPQSAEEPSDQKDEENAPINAENEEKQTDIFSVLDNSSKQKPISKPLSDAENENGEQSVIEKKQTERENFASAPVFTEAPENNPEKTDKTAKPLTAAEKKALEAEMAHGLQQQTAHEYVYPPVDCLKLPVLTDRNYDTNELKANGDKLIAALQSFNVSASIVDVVPGPTVTRYELSPAPGVKISKFLGLSDDLALHLAAPAGLRIEAPIPNKAAIGIEIPNRKKATITFREVIENDTFKNAKSRLNVALGKDISGEVIFCDIAKMPHLLVAGTTGSGKSVCLNTMIMSILYNATPDEVKIILIDPKQVEFGIYSGLPHLLVPVVSDPRKASGALAWAVTEMLNRYKTLNANGVRDIGAYNALCEAREDLTKMSQIVIFIDELSDLMSVAPGEVEESIMRLAQMARAAGMHLVVATQRPSVDVITGVIKANIPSRIALTVKSQVDSRTIIDQSGAEKLMGYGDMLYYPVGLPKPIRVQGAFLSDSEIEKVVNYIKSNGTAVYDDEVLKEIERQAAQEKKKGQQSEPEPQISKDGDLIMRAVELFVNTPEKASISAMQRYLGLGFAKAGRVMDELEEKGFVGPAEGSKPRKVLVTKAQWYEMRANSSTEEAPEEKAPKPETDDETEDVNPNNDDDE